MALDALCDTRKDTKVSTCVLSQGKKEIWRYFPACKTHGSCGVGFFLKDQSQDCRKSLLLSEAAQETHSLLPTEKKKWLKGGSQHSFKFLKHFLVIFMTL